MAASKPTEDDLRRAKDNLERVVTDQQRALGVPDPGGRAVAKFIDPILEKVARGPKDETPTAQTPDKVHEARDTGDDVEVTQLGSYDWDLRTNEFKAYPGSYMPTPRDRIRLFIRWLLHNPETNATFLGIARLCDKHTDFAKHCTLCERRETRFRQALRQCAVKYGYGKYKDQPKVFSVATGAK